MRILNWNDLSFEAKADALRRPAALMDEPLAKRVAEILQAVKQNGDVALRECTKRFDGVNLDDFKVPSAHMLAAWQNLAETDKAVLKLAKANIEAFHKAQMPRSIEVQTMPGVMCRREPRPMDSVGLYVPGGSAPLVSTLMMLAIPAKIAGVAKRVVTTPPDKKGNINPYILAAAHLCEVTGMYKVGGAQAIAALGFGTNSIPKCVKIFGPGNAYVAQAKAQISMQMGGPAIDLPAGPSEAMVLTDDDANPVFVAADLLSQAEHDPLAQVILACRSQDFADAVNIQIAQQLPDLPRRSIAEQALQNGRIFVVSSQNDLHEIANEYAPEHLIVQVKNPERLVDQIRNAGSIFLGPWTPESVGDYASGTNHTLPTFGAARSYSGVTLESFFKYISIQQLTHKGLQNLGPCVERLAEMEGLQAHKNAVRLRLENRS